MDCPKCGAKTYTMAQDSRGIPEARCTECGAFIKKMSTGEVIEYFQTLDKKSVEQADLEIKSKPLCRYCTENYYMRQGRLGTIYIPIENKFCPMCGREGQKGDRDYK